jgi:hypothetical protein
MSEIKDTRLRLKSKLEAIKKINDNPDGFVDSVSDKYLKDLPSSEIYGKKLDDFLSNRKKQKENKKDIFSDLVEIAEDFLTGGKKVQSDSRLFTKSRIKQHAINATTKTINNTKEILTSSIKKSFFVGDGICGTDTELSGTTIQIKPEEIDFLNVLTVNPTTPTGQILYEPTSPNTGKEKVNRELYDTFNGGSYSFTSNNDTLFDMSWNQSGQFWDFTNFEGKNAEEFLNDYFSTVELPDIEAILKNTMLMTLQGGGDSGGNTNLTKGLNNVNRLLNKLFTVCGSDKDQGELKNQNPTDLFNENDEDIESYFDFDDVEGIDLDDEDVRFRKVLKFRDCNDFEIPINPTTLNDFVYFTNKKRINELVDTTINRISTEAYINSDSSIPLVNFNINLMSNFIMNLPKTIVSSILSPKVFLPIVVLYKSVKSQVSTLNVNNLMKRLSKLFYSVIKQLFWSFIREFWRLIKTDLLSLVGSIVKKIIKNKYKRYLKIIKSLIAFLIKILDEKIDNCYSLFNAVMTAINTSLNAKSPLRVPGPLLLLSNRLPGYSQDRAFMNIIERLESVGVDTGPVFGETSNLLQLVKSIIDGNTEEMDQNSFVRITLEGGIVPGPTGGGIIPPGTIMGTGKFL